MRKRLATYLKVKPHSSARYAMSTISLDLCSTNRCSDFVNFLGLSSCFRFDSSSLDSTSDASSLQWSCTTRSAATRRLRRSDSDSCGCRWLDECKCLKCRSTAISLSFQTSSYSTIVNTGPWLLNLLSASLGSHSRTNPETCLYFSSMAFSSSSMLLSVALSNLTFETLMFLAVIRLELV